MAKLNSRGLKLLLKPLVNQNICKWGQDPPERHCGRLCCLLYVMQSTRHDSDEMHLGLTHKHKAKRNMFNCMCDVVIMMALRSFIFVTNFS